MAMIKRTITVMDLRNTTFHEKPVDFKITKLINTVSYKIGQELSAHEVGQIIQQGTTVNVIPYKR